MKQVKSLINTSVTLNTPSTFYSSYLFNKNDNETQILIEGQSVYAIFSQRAFFQINKNILQFIIRL